LVVEPIRVFEKPDLGDPGPRPHARFGVRARADWVADPATVLVFDGQPIGRNGTLGAEVLGATTAGVPAQRPAMVVPPGTVLTIVDRGIFSVPLRGRSAVRGVATGVVDG
jgi:hypothetical protein